MKRGLAILAAIACGLAVVFCDPYALRWIVSALAVLLFAWAANPTENN